MGAGAATLGDIVSLDWSLMLDSTAGGSRGAGLGRVVQGLDDVEQCLKVILTTPKGADPLRPTFGTNLWQYVDVPINVARAGIVREVTEAVILWEPRIELVRVSTMLAQNDTLQPGAHLSINVVWRPKLSGTNTIPRSTRRTTLILIG
jgi:hypothetical protein